MTAPHQLDALLRETRWLSGLAQQLVARGEDAEDLVQETMRTACEHPPTPGRPVRGWLRTVLVNRWRDVVRSERARVERERAAVTKTDAPATVDVVAKAEVHRDLVRTVLALDEPYRSTLLLRFFENLPPREIARQTGVPIATVHSRLQRGLAKMRERMAESHGPRWPLAVAPLLHRNPVAPMLVGGTLVNTLAKVTLGVAAVAVAALCWHWFAEPSPADEDSKRSTGSSLTAEAGKDKAGDAQSKLERAVVTTPPPTDVTSPATPKLRGRVIDLTGAGIAGVTLTVGDRDDAPTLSSGADGAFVFALDSTSRSGNNIVSTDPKWATVLAGSTRSPQPDQVTVIVAPRLELGGRVVDIDGQPVPNANVQVHLPLHLGADLGIVLDYSVSMSWRTRSDDNGRFALREVPAVTQGKVWATRGGYLPRIVALPTASTPSLELVLERPGVGNGTVEGIVVDPLGAPVAGARVSAGREVSTTDARGAFTIDLAREKTLGRIVAVAKGMQPTVFVPERDAAGAAAWPARVVLRLGQPPKSITGQVVDRDREPVAGAKVWIEDPLVVGFDGNTMVLAETFLGREDTPFWAFVLTDDAGRFRIDGLLDRAYVLRALAPKTLVATTKRDVQAGSRDVELHLTTATHPELRGRVVARDGTALPGVTVRLTRHALSVTIPGNAGASMFEWTNSPPVETDENGAFVLRDVPVEGVQVKALGDTILPAYVSIRAGVDPKAFELQVDRRMHLQVELAAPHDRADEVRVLDTTGRRMLLRVMLGGKTNQNFRFPIQDGRSHVLSIGENAKTVVLFKDGAEVARLPVQLQTGQVNKVRF